ncbi:branched-chain amino acid transporter permease [Treponema brennaborense]|uniref:Branched-chain amino acid transport n=1 Tax=Treponema brennaborense (strain DSM 12168 / CIP 105900 / DD5/3) TaxID=906968 RepID=F4LPV0_TREBD|nr:AzlD domain-containing protein [Treponema brennaborense]AEE16042.1 branched-chain amino acid transport [Treponema brennaborense DSM 12168]
MPLTVSAALAATAVSALVIFGTRLFPFALFSRREPPALLKFIEKYIPPMIMAILLVYCFNGVPFTEAPYGLPHLAALAVTVGTYLWKSNSMLSIFGGTVVFMLLNGALPA